MADIKFISYDGKYPNLCSGKLVIEVNGKRYDNFYLNSNGSAGLDCNRDPFVREGKWSVEVPTYLEKYKKEITDIVNECVPHGCCGGCV